jgi:hypothetical protein
MDYTSRQAGGGSRKDLHLFGEDLRGSGRMRGLEYMFRVWIIPGGRLEGVHVRIYTFLARI